MKASVVRASRFLELAILGILIVGASCNKTSSNDNSSLAAPAVVAIAPLSANDVSWLFPAPNSAADFVNLIAVRDVTTPDPQDYSKRNPIWPDSVFEQFLNI